VAEEVDRSEMVSFKKLLLSNVYTQGALNNLLEKKGIITKGELLEEIRRIKGKGASKGIEKMTNDPGIPGTVLKHLKWMKNERVEMSTDYVPSKNISFSELKIFNHMGVRVDTIDELENIILTDGTNYMWVWPNIEENQDKTLKSGSGSNSNDVYLGVIFTRYADNDPTRIIKAAEDFFKVRLIAEYEEEYYYIVSTYDTFS